MITQTTKPKISNKSLARAVDYLWNSASKDERIAACYKSFPLFCATYFSHYIDSPFADFHFMFMDDIENMKYDNFVLWKAFRASAKTSIAKMAICWWIVYKLRRFIIVDSYDGSNSKQIVMDTAGELAFNRRLIDDFGALFSKSRITDEMTIKTQTEFKANNGVWVQAGSAGTKFRGRLKGAKRPDAAILDDMENTETISSDPLTEKVKSHIQELMTGMKAGDSWILFLGNGISRYHNVSWIEKSGNFIVRDVPLVDKEGNIAWAKFTPEMVEELRRINGDRFEPEYNNNPDHNSVRFLPELNDIRANIEYRTPKKDRIVLGVDTGLTTHIIGGDSHGIFLRDSSVGYAHFEHFMKKYPNAIAIFDPQGDLMRPRELAQKYKGRIYFCYFRPDVKSEDIVKHVEKNGISSNELVADRNRLISWVYDELVEQKLYLYGTDEYWKPYIDCWKVMYRTTEPTAVGNRKVWKREGADHLVLAHAYYRAGLAVIPKKQTTIEI